MVKHCEENNGTQLIRMRQYTSRDTLVKKKRTHTKVYLKEADYVTSHDFS